MQTARLGSRKAKILGSRKRPRICTGHLGEAQEVELLPSPRLGMGDEESSLQTQIWKVVTIIIVRNASRAL